MHASAVEKKSRFETIVITRRNNQVLQSFLQLRPSLPVSFRINLATHSHSPTHSSPVLFTSLAIFALAGADPLLVD